MTEAFAGMIRQLIDNPQKDQSFPLNMEMFRLLGKSYGASAEEMDEMIANIPCEPLRVTRKWPSIMPELLNEPFAGTEGRYFWFIPEDGGEAEILRVYRLEGHLWWEDLQDVYDEYKNSGWVSMKKGKWQHIPHPLTGE